MDCLQQFPPSPGLVATVNDMWCSLDDSDWSTVGVAVLEKINKYRAMRHAMFCKDSILDLVIPYVA